MEPITTNVYLAYTCTVYNEFILLKVKASNPSPMTVVMVTCCPASGFCFLSTCSMLW